MLDLEELGSIEDVTDKLFRCKTRIQKMQQMQKLGIGFGMVECFLRSVNQQKKVEREQGPREAKVCKEIMGIKIKDEKKMHKLLKTKHQELMKRMGDATGRGTRKHQRMRKHLNWVGRNARESIEKKYERKVTHLRTKHQTDARNKRIDKIETKWRGLLPDLRIYKEVDGSGGPPTPQKANEIYKIGDFRFKPAEERLLAYPPKATILRDFKMTNFDQDNQQMGCKLRWEDRRVEEHNQEQETLPDENIKKYEDLDEREKEGIILQEGKDKRIYDR